MKFSFLFLFISIACYSQSKTARGIVLDELTQKPIPYVNISILESKFGTSSEEDGSYELEIEEKDFDKNVHLSSLGYKDSLITVENLMKQHQIFLKPIAEQLNEVVISKKFEEKFLIVNPINRKEIKSAFGSGAKPWNLALFFPYLETYQATKYIQSIKVHLAKFHKRPSKFRLRLFTIEEDSLPGQDLIFENLIVETVKGQKEIDIDIAKFNLSFPSKGFFVCIEVLAIPYNEFEQVFNYNHPDGTKTSKKEIVYAPNIGAFYSKMNSYKTVYFTNGIWLEMQLTRSKQEEIYSQIIVPAISLTLSN